MAFGDKTTSLYPPSHNHSTFPRPSCQPSPFNSHLPHLTKNNPSALFTCPNHLSLLCLNLTERSSTPHISATSLLDLLSYHLTSDMYLNILWSHLCRTSISLLVNAHVCAPYIRADLTQASYTLPIVLSSMLRFPSKLVISCHLLHAAVYFRSHCSLHSCFTVQHIFQIAKLFYFLQHVSIYYQFGTLVFSIIVTTLPPSCTSWI